MHLFLRTRALFVSIAIAIAGCSNGSGNVEEGAVPEPPSVGAQVDFTVGGTVSGLTGSGLVLQNNATDAIEIAGNGAFTFPGRWADGATYAVTVRTQPAEQICTVRNGSGTIAGASITNVEVACASTGSPAPTFSVSGSVSGLTGSGLRLGLNGAEERDIASNGSFTFASELPSGSQYRVSVTREPAGQSCTVTNGVGAIQNMDVTNVRVTCAVGTFAVGGTVSGLLGSGLVLQNNGADDLSIGANGRFTFATRVPTGTEYRVTVARQPSDPRQTCTIANGRGTVATADVTNVAVTCRTTDFTIGGTVRNLEGEGLILRNNGTDALMLDSSGPFTFDTALPTGAAYNVVVAEQPRNPVQNCTVTNGFGIVGSTNVTNVIVDCVATRGFRVGGRVSGLRGTGLVLQNNGADNLSIASNGPFRFASRLPTGAGYNVTVAAQPRNPGQTCTIRDGVGTIGNADVRNIEVRCRGDDDD